MAGLLLGSIQFVDREVPDTIKAGGIQKLAIHNQIGGTRVIDAMGPEPHSITWSGLFYGSSASKRARQVDSLRQSGSEVTLSWGSFNYTVVVADFNFTYKNEWEVRYSIKCEVVNNNNQSQPVSLTAIFTIDFSNVLAIASGFGGPAALPNLLPGLPNSTNLGSISLTPTAVTNINAALNTISTTIAGGGVPASPFGTISISVAAISGIVNTSALVNGQTVIDADGQNTIYSSMATIQSVSDGNSGLPTNVPDIIDGALAAIGAAISANPAIPASVVNDVVNAQKTFNAAAKAAGGSILDVSLAQVQPVVDAANTALNTLNSEIGTPIDGVDIRAADTQTSVLDGINDFVNEVTRRSNESDQFVMRGYLGRIASNLRMLGG